MTHVGWALQRPGQFSRFSWIKSANIQLKHFYHMNERALRERIRKTQVVVDKGQHINE